MILLRSYGQVLSVLEMIELHKFTVLLVDGPGSR